MVLVPTHGAMYCVRPMYGMRVMYCVRPMYVVGAAGSIPTIRIVEAGHTRQTIRIVRTHWIGPAIWIVDVVHVIEPEQSGKETHKTPLNLKCYMNSISRYSSIRVPTDRDGVSKNNGAISQEYSKI